MSGGSDVGLAICQCDLLYYSVSTLCCYVREVFVLYPMSGYLAS